MTTNIRNIVKYLSHNFTDLGTVHIIRKPTCKTAYKMPGNMVNSYGLQTEHYKGTALYIKGTRHV